MQSTPLHERNKLRPCTLLSFHSDNSSDINLAGHNRVALRISMPVQTGWFQLSPLCLFLGLCSSVSLRRVWKPRTRLSRPCDHRLYDPPTSHAFVLAQADSPPHFFRAVFSGEQNGKQNALAGREAPKRKSQIVSPHMYYRPWSSAGWLGVLAS